jgi:hypothetical protein
MTQPANQPANPTEEFQGPKPVTRTRPEARAKAPVVKPIAPVEVKVPAQVPAEAPAEVKLPAAPAPIKKVVVELVDSTLVIPMLKGRVEGYKAKHMEIQLNEYQAEKLARALLGLKTTNATMRNGNPVYRPAHVLTYIIEKLADAE